LNFGAIFSIRNTIKERIHTGPRSSLMPPPLERAFKMHPSVAKATEDELIAAGYADVDRCNIPADWAERARVRLTPKQRAAKFKKPARKRR
jgi:hypothetical protein